MEYGPDGNVLPTYYVPDTLIEEEYENGRQAAAEPYSILSDNPWTKNGMGKDSAYDDRRKSWMAGWLNIDPITGLYLGDDDETDEYVVKPYTSKKTTKQLKRAIDWMEQSLRMATQATELEPQDDDNNELSEISAALDYLRKTVIKS